MSETAPLRVGQTLIGPLFNEPMRVETVSAAGNSSWVVGLVGAQSERFRRVTMSESDLATISILDAEMAFNGDGNLLRLGIQAYTLGIAYDFDPYFGLSISRVDPLPHQLEAVYDYLLKLARVRFLLADDAGAGKTMMAGLLIKELKLRGMCERILIVAPANLAFQWQRELMEEGERERLEHILEAISLAGNAEDVRAEIVELKQLAMQAKAVEKSGVEAKLCALKNLMQEQGFFDHPDQRLLLFTEFKDTLDYLVAKLVEWGFRVGSIHGSMRIGSRDDPGSRLNTEQQFREGAIQILVATEAAGEGINLQCCNILFNYDIPWNPNRLEQRMGRIHRYGQTKNCLIFNFYRARVVDGLGHVIHERMFAVEVADGREPVQREPAVLGDLTPAESPDPLPEVAHLPEASFWLHEHGLRPFLDEVRSERLTEVDRIADHVELSLTELLSKADEEIGRAAAEVDDKAQGAEGRMAQAETRHTELLARRERRRQELQQQRSLTLQAVERITSILVLPHPDRASPEVRRLRPNPVTEATAMRVVMEHERAQGRQVFDVSEKNLGYDITSVDLQSGDLRLIEVKGIGDTDGSVLLTPNERRVAEDRRDCYWLYVVTHCNTTPRLCEPIKDPARLQWTEVVKVAHYRIDMQNLS